MSVLNDSKTPLCRELLAYFVLTFLLVFLYLGYWKIILEKLHLEQGKAKDYHLLAWRALPL